MEIVFFIVLAIFAFVIIEYNILTTLKNKVKQSKSAIDIYLTQRFDLIPNLVETVKAAAKHEQEVFSRVAALRSNYMSDNNKDLKKAAYLNSEFNNVLGIAESMPEIKANKNFLRLQDTLIKMENQLQAARRLYNGDVTLYNTKISTFPGNIIANSFAFKQEDLLEIEEYKKQNPMV